MPAPTTEPLPQAIVIHVHDPELRAQEVDAICAATDKARATAPSLPFILDLAAVKFMGSSAMGNLVGLNKEFKNRNQRLLFVNLQKDVLHSFTVSHFNKTMEILPDLPTTLQSLAATK